MVLHICKDCDKNFNKKSHYIAHRNRKIKCKSFDEQNINNEKSHMDNGGNKKNSYSSEVLSDLNNNICHYCNESFWSKSNVRKHIQNNCKVIRENERKTHNIFVDQLAQKYDKKFDDSTKQNKQIIEKLEKLEAQNKDLCNKISKISKKNDTSIIKMNDQNNIYLIQEREFIKTEEDIYKIGKTTRDVEKRKKEYPKGSKMYFNTSVSDCHKCEDKIKEVFNEEFVQRLDIGTEYFEGNLKDMMKKISQICSDFY